MYSSTLRLKLCNVKLCNVVSPACFSSYRNLPVYVHGALSLAKKATARQSNLMVVVPSRISIFVHGLLYAASYSILTLSSAP